MISTNQQRYIEEYEKHKHIVIDLGLYKVKKNERTVYEIIEIDPVKEVASLKKDGFLTTKTLHWCRKNLEKID